MTNTTNIQELANKLQSLVHSYDSFTMYIDNYRQMKQAEASNDRISKEFVDTCAEYGIQAHINDCGSLSGKTGTIYSKQTVEEAVAEYISKFIKEDETMNTTTNVTVNETTIKEETTMKRAIAIVDTETKECVETTLDTLSLDELIAMKELTKDIVRAYLEEENIKFSNNEFKKTKRLVLIEELYMVMHPEEFYSELSTDNVTTNETTPEVPKMVPECKCTRCGGSGIFYTRVENNIPIKAIPDNGVCYRCNGSGLEPEKKTRTYATKPATVPVGDFSSDTAPVTLYDEILKKVTLQADTNNQRDFISDWMLSSIISEIIVGLPLKKEDSNGKWVECHKSFTEEQKTKINETKQTFLEESKLVPNFNPKKNAVTGYRFPVELLIKCRKEYLNKNSCTYIFYYKESGKSVIYHVTRDSIFNTVSKNRTVLDDSTREAAFQKLFNTCYCIK